MKNAIFADTGLRLFGYARKADLAKPDRFAEMKAEYERAGASRSNRRYGYIHQPG